MSYPDSILPLAVPSARSVRAHRAFKAACILGLLLLPLLLAPAPPVRPQATVARFHGDYPGAFSFTFDDAMPSQLIYAAPYLDRVGLKGTFFLITGLIADGEAGSPAIGKPTVWADWKALAGGGHEIGAHTLTHPDLTTIPFEEAGRQMRESALRIEERLGITPVTFAFPFHGRNPALEKAALQTYIAVRDAQVGYGDLHRPFFRRRADRRPGDARGIGRSASPGRGTGTLSGAGGSRSRNHHLDFLDVDPRARKSKETPHEKGAPHGPPLLGRS